MSIAAHAESVRLEPRFVANSLFTLTRFARAGFGISFLTEFAMIHELRPGEFLAVPIAQPLLQDAEARALVKKRPESHPTGSPLQHVAKDLGSSAARRYLRIQPTIVGVVARSGLARDA